MADFSDASFELLLEGIKFGGHELIGVLSNKIVDSLEAMTADEVQACTVGLLTQLENLGTFDDTLIRNSLIALSNLTTHEENCKVFLAEVATGSRETTSAAPLHSLIKHFVTYKPQAVEPSSLTVIDEEFDPWCYIGNIICNICRLEEGRKHLLKASDGYIPLLSSQIRSRNKIRRFSSVATMRNLLFDSEVHWWMLHEAKITTSILYPLVVSTPFTSDEKKGMDPVLWMAADTGHKKHEPEADILHMLLECLLLLCQKKSSRVELRKLKVYPVLKNLDAQWFQENDVEKSISSGGNIDMDDPVSTTLRDVVDFLMRYEEGNDPDEQPIEKASGPSPQDETLDEVD